MAKKSKSCKKVGARGGVGGGSTTPTEDSTTAEAMDIEEEEEMDEGAEEVWDIIEVLQDKQTDHVCRTDGCNSAAVAVWKSNLLDDPSDVWPMCEPCQEQSFGGWPDDCERPTTSEEKGNGTATPPPAEGSMLENATKRVDDEAATPNDDGETADTSATTSNDKCNSDAHEEPPTGDCDNSASSDNDEQGNDDADEPEELWDLKKIMSIAAVTHECPIKCSRENCALPAAASWVSNLKPTENWYSCLDCQESDFGGWPEDFAELPVQHMTQEHKDALIDKCSKYKDAAMPVFSESPAKGETALSTALANTITPPPNSGVFATQNKDPNKGKSTITPIPAAMELESQKPDAIKKPAASAKPSKAQLEIHRKWQAAAEAAGGSDTRIVLSKPAAKKIIYDFLYDAFRPMNITEIHKGLKAIVPSPILKACLDDMALDTDTSTQFADSDDDDDEAPTKKKSKKKEEEPTEAVPYKNSLTFKAGKGSNSSLYYVNYNTAKNGDGLDREEKNKLASDLAAAEAEEAALKQTLATMRTTTAKLISEPKNEEADRRLEKEEAELSDLTEQLEAARKLKVNEKHKATTKKRIEHFASFWRKRRRLCMDFLVTMEEVTDGTIIAKKCLLGDGQIDCDSDELVAKQVIAYANSKRAKGNGKKLAFAKVSASTKTGIQPSESFVAVLLDSQGSVSRVHLEADQSK